MRQGDFITPRLFKRLLLGFAANGYQQIGAGQSRGNRFAKGAGGQHTAIAKTDGGIHHHYGYILVQGGVLKPVVQHNDVGPRIHSGLGPFSPILGNPCGGERGKQQWFVASFGGTVTDLIHLNRPLK